MHRWVYEKSTQSLSSVFDDCVFSLGNMTANPVSALINANYVGILTWSVILGLALRKIASDNTKDMLSDISDAVSKVVGWVIHSHRLESWDLCSPL